MRRSCLAASAVAAIACAALPASAADMRPHVGPHVRPYVVAPAPRVVAVEPAGPAAGCWRYGALGWGWYPCWAGPPAYWHTYRYGWRPYWARHHWRKWGYW